MWWSNFIRFLLHYWEIIVLLGSTGVMIQWERCIPGPKKWCINQWQAWKSKRQTEDWKVRGKLIDRFAECAVEGHFYFPWRCPMKWITACLCCTIDRALLSKWRARGLDSHPPVQHSVFSVWHRMDKRRGLSFNVAARTYPLDNSRALVWSEEQSDSVLCSVCFSAAVDYIWC